MASAAKWLTTAYGVAFLPFLAGKVGHLKGVFFFLFWYSNVIELKALIQNGVEEI